MHAGRASCLLVLLVAGMLSSCAVGDRSTEPSGDAAAALPEIPHTLSGLDADQLATLFGPADFRRIDGPAEILRFGARGCVLHVILYRSTDNAPPKVAHVEARNDALDPLPARPCIESLVRARHAPSTS